MVEFLRRKKVAYVLTFVVLVSSFSILIWSVTHVSIPNDVRPKLDDELIEEIEKGSYDAIHDCIILCKSLSDMGSVIDTLPNASVEQVWEFISGFHAYLSVDEIFRLARMEEVTSIGFNGMISISSFEDI